MKNFKKVLALVLVVATLLSFATVASAATSKDYTDAASIKNTAAVDVLSYLGVMNGYPDKTFRPNATITRAEASKIIAIFNNGTDIESLFAAANPFTDVEKGHWAESYIAYCYKTGIVAGVGDLKFDPNGTVSNAAFVKMALVVLGYDAKKEGLEGASWMVNTLALAKKAGLLNGLGNLDFGAPMTRGNAAQVMLNALNSFIVDYGYEYKPENYITTAGAVVVTGKYLYQAWGINPNWEGTDCYYRPYTTWTVGNYVGGVYTPTGIIAQYFATPVATWNTEVNACDLLVAAGYAKTNFAPMTLKVYVDGADAETVTLQHGTAYNCPAELVSFGGQGTVSELYFWNGEWRLVIVHTVLGVVTNVNTAYVGKDDHLLSATTLTVETFNAENVDDNTVPQFATYTMYGNADGFAIGDFVLVNFSEKDCHTNLNNVHITAIEAAPYKAAKLTGFVDDNKGLLPETEVDGVETPDADLFNLGRLDAKLVANLKKGYIFLFDQFGNVIGMVDQVSTPAAPTYAVVNSIWSHAHRDYTVTADLVGMDAQWIKDANIADVPYPSVDALAALNDEWYHTLYTYATDGTNYWLAPAEAATAQNVWMFAGEPNLWDSDLRNEGATYIAATNEYTQYLFHDLATNTYTAYTGYKAIPYAVKANKVEYVVGSDGYVDVVYACGLQYPGKRDVVFTFENTVHYTKVIDGRAYEVWTVYANGEWTTVYTLAAQNPAEDQEFDGMGFYTVEYETVDGIVVAKILNQDMITDKLFPVYSCIDSVLKLTVDGQGYNVSDVPVYKIDVYNGTISAGVTADLHQAEYVYADTVNGAFYVFDFAGMEAYAPY